MNTLLAGYAEVDFTPAPGQALQGQHFARVGKTTRDPLMAVAAAYASGDEVVVIVAVDMCFFPTPLATRTQQEFERRTGLPAARLLVHATHSHVAPYSMDNYWGKADPAFLDSLCEAVLDATQAAVSRLKPVSAFAGAGWAEYLGWNRRAMFADGTSQMHGKANRPDFVGSEGPRDGVLSVLFTRNTAGGITGAIVNLACHPNSVECENYYSADIPGEVRRLLKLWLGQDVVIVYLTGAAGNVTPLILEPYTPVQPWMGEEGLLRSGMVLAGEAAKVIAATTEPMRSQVVKAQREVLRIPIRPYPPPGHINYPQKVTEESAEHYKRQEADWPRFMREESPAEVRVNAVRIGDAAICTNPGELFVEFGLRIRELSSAPVNIISELTDGHVGYIPTLLAFSRGGYETWPSYTSKLVPEAGDRIVESTCRLLGNIFER